jgi:NAD(P)-dependent dehydrogenase (short-subunit alcohol dehydrogenase family)
MSDRADGGTTGDFARPLVGRYVLVIGSASPPPKYIADAARDGGAVDAYPALSGETRDTNLPAGVELDVDRSFDSAAAELQTVDTVIAVIAPPPLPVLHEVTLDCWRECVTAPLRDVFWLARRTVEAFLADSVAGRLVVVLDPPSDDDEPSPVVVDALRSFASSFAREYGRRALACNVVIRHPSPDSVPHLALVETVRFLASPAASFVNGETLVVRCAAPTGIESP